MKWQKEEFIHRVDKMLGKHPIVKKMTGKDKRKIKEELGLSVAPNRIIKRFEAVERIMNTRLFTRFWAQLLSYTQ